MPGQPSKDEYAAFAVACPAGMKIKSGNIKSTGCQSIICPVNATLCTITRCSKRGGYPSHTSRITCTRDDQSPPDTLEGPCQMQQIRIDSLGHFVHQSQSMKIAEVEVFAVGGKKLQAVGAAMSTTLGAGTDAAQCIDGDASNGGMMGDKILQSYRGTLACVEAKHEKGAKVELETSCSATESKQRWLYDPATGLIRTGGGLADFCWKLESSSSFKRIVLWPCSAQDSDQVWHYRPELGGYQHITHKATALCADQYNRRLQGAPCVTGISDQKQTDQQLFSVAGVSVCETKWDGNSVYTCDKVDSVAPCRARMYHDAGGSSGTCDKTPKCSTFDGVDSTSSTELCCGNGQGRCKLSGTNTENGDALSVDPNAWINVNSYCTSIDFIRVTDGCGIEVASSTNGAGTTKDYEGEDATVCTTPTIGCSGVKSIRMYRRSSNRDVYTATPGSVAPLNCTWTPRPKLTSSGWIDKANVKCNPPHAQTRIGGTSFTSVQADLEACKARCTSTPSCTCVSYEASSRSCWLRAQCKMGKCEASTGVTSSFRQGDPSACASGFCIQSCSASSTYSSYTCDRVYDVAGTGTYWGTYSAYNSASSQYGVGTWIELVFEGIMTVSGMRWAPKSTSYCFKEVSLAFDDGSTQQVTLQNSVRPKLFLLTPVKTSSVRLTALSVHYSSSGNSRYGADILTFDFEKPKVIGGCAPICKSGTSCFWEEQCTEAAPAAAKVSSTYYEWDPYLHYAESPGACANLPECSTCLAAGTCGSTQKNIPVQAYMGSSGCSSSYRCRSCEGDCDSDSDCAAGLKCFQRGSTDTVPSCAGDSSRYYSSEDYCYDPKSADRGLCTSKSVSFGKVTRQICTNTPTVCAVIMKGQIEIKTCRQYCAVYGMQCTGQYGKYTYNDDDDQFRYGGYGGENDGTQCQKGKAGSCDDAGGTQTCECAEVDQRTRESQLRPVATKTESQPWLTVDLGKVVSVGKIRVTAYSHDGDYDAGKEDYIGLEGARISTSAGTGWNATANWRGFFKGNKRVHEFYVCDKAGPTVATTSTTTTTQPVTTTTTTAQCPAGKFLIGQSTGAEQCAACSNGQYRSELSHRFTTCQTQTVCRIGTSYTGGSTTAAAKCVACKPGTYQNNDNHQLGTCKPQTMCSAGEYLAGASTSSAGTCNSCNTGQFQDSPTSHREAKCKEQNQCTPGQYLAAASITAPGVCTGCDEGAYQDAPSGHRSLQCKAQNMCIDAGQYLSGASSTSPGICSSCSDGQYQDAPRNHRTSTCKPHALCDAGQVLSAASISKAGICSSCAEGQYQNAASHRFTFCTKKGSCGAGKFVSGGSFTDTGSCLSCVKGQYQNENNHQIAACKVHDTCVPGQFLATGAQTSMVAGVCTACKEGEYQDAVPDSSASCKPQAACGQGTFLSNASSTAMGSCKSCPASEFQEGSNHRFTSCKTKTTTSTTVTAAPAPVSTAAPSVGGSTAIQTEVAPYATTAATGTEKLCNGNTDPDNCGLFSAGRCDEVVFNIDVSGKCPVLCDSCKPDEPDEDRPSDTPSTTTTTVVPSSTLANGTDAVGTASPTQKALSEEAAQLFRILDGNADGKISITEFVGFCGSGVSCDPDELLSEFGLVLANKEEFVASFTAAVNKGSKYEKKYLRGLLEQVKAATTTGPLVSSTTTDTKDDVPTAASSKDDSSGGGILPNIVIAAVVLLVVGAAAFYVNKSKNAQRADADETQVTPHSFSNPAYESKGRSKSNLPADIDGGSDGDLYDNQTSNAGIVTAEDDESHGPMQETYAVVGDGELDGGGYLNVTTGYMNTAAEEDNDVDL